MDLIVGLGNPGKEYEQTPHNLGFEVVNELARRWGASWRRVSHWRGELAEARRDAVGGAAGEPGTIRLLKPLTYMNLSGEAVRPCADFYRIEPERILVISDDLCLPLGRLRLRMAGSAGGHKGLISLIRHLGTENFPRLRVGCGPEEGAVENRVDYVLGRFSRAEWPWVEKITLLAADAVEMILREGMDRAGNEWNGRKIEPPGR